MSNIIFVFVCIENEIFALFIYCIVCQMHSYT